MSNLFRLPSTESHFVPGSNASIQHQAADSYVNLNDVLQAVVAKLYTDVSIPNAIIRQDVLPSVPGTELQWQHLFFEVLTSIVMHPPQNSKLFLYISCKPDVSEVIDADLPSDLKNYAIYVYTNSCSPAATQNQNEQVATSVGGIRTFNYQPVSDTCFLYTLTTPGKL